ncbi:exported hypothetical protein [Verrucomicrobia bacterium]|nr:exported hypothetical protein [Verrucomicrobiota bacterium]
MKKMLVTITLAAASAAAFAQGKVSLQNDPSCLYTMPTAPWRCAPQDQNLAGQPIPISGPLPSGAVLEVGLYGGTASTLLTLQTAVLLNPVGGSGAPWDGMPPATHVHIDGTPNSNGDGSLGMTGYVAGDPAYFQVAVWDSAYANPFIAEACMSPYVGFNHVFSMTPGTSIPYLAINLAGGTTWIDAGNEHPLILGIIPEPSALALAGSATALLFIFRRRKS